MSMYHFVIKYQGPMDEDGIKTSEGDVYLTNMDFRSGESYWRIAEANVDLVGNYELVKLELIAE